jgi:hypothetical protein
MKYFSNINIATIATMCMLASSDPIDSGKLKAKPINSVSNRQKRDFTGILTGWSVPACGEDGGQFTTLTWSAITGDGCRPQTNAADPTTMLSLQITESPRPYSVTFYSGPGCDPDQIIETYDDSGDACIDFGGVGFQSIAVGEQSS